MIVLYKKVELEQRTDSTFLHPAIGPEYNLFPGRFVPAYTVDKLNNADHLVFIDLEGEEEVEEIHRMWRKSNDNAALHCLLEFLDEVG